MQVYGEKKKQLVKTSWDDAENRMIWWSVPLLLFLICSFVLFYEFILWLNYWNYYSDSLEKLRFSFVTLVIDL